MTFNPVFAVPETVTTATLQLGDHAKVEVMFAPAKSALQAEFFCKTRVLSAQTSKARVHSDYPKFQDKPGYAMDWRPITGEWSKLTVEFEPEKGNHWGNPNTYQIDASRYGILQKVNGKAVFTACAGREWNSGVADMPERIQVGEKVKVTLYFAVPSLAPKGQLTYEGRPVADFSFQ